MSFTERPAAAATTQARPRVSLLALARVFLKMGALTFGGMWAAMLKIEDELVHRQGWLTADDQKAMMLTAALIPAPKFLAFGGMVGYRLRGFPGSFVALVALMLPGALLVLIFAMTFRQGQEGSLLAAVQRMVSLGIIGLLLGNAVKMARSTKDRSWRLPVGLAIAVSVPLATLLFGAPLMVVAIGGLALGALLIRPPRGNTDDG